VPFQVYILERPDGPSGKQVWRWHFDLDEDDLRTRIVDAWDRGDPITYNGRTSDSTKSEITIWESVDPLRYMPTHVPTTSQVDRAANRVTNDWITGPAGAGAPVLTPAAAGIESPLRDHRRVMVVYGRNLAARDAMFTLLRALGLNPIEWEQAVAETGMGSPHNFDAVRAAMDVAQALVVILTAEDRAAILPELQGDDDDDIALRGQPRQNVILEAGLAMGVDRSRTILVELGKIRRASDFEGLNAVRLTNTTQTRNALRQRLITAGCAVDQAASDWMTASAGGDFDTAVIPWEPRLVD
jgi:predicted nucleotide-binding protein